MMYFMYAFCLGLHADGDLHREDVSQADGVNRCHRLALQVPPNIESSGKILETNSFWADVIKYRI